MPLKNRRLKLLNFFIILNHAIGNSSIPKEPPVISHIGKFNSIGNSEF